MKRAAAVSVLTVLALTVVLSAACGQKKLSDAVVGTWAMADGSDVTVELSSDGTYLMSTFGSDLEGTWEVESENAGEGWITIIMSAEGEPDTERTLIFDEGERDRFMVLLMGDYVEMVRR